MTLLAVENLHVHLKCQDEVVKAVNGINFQISSGEIFCLVGESGSGKSVCALSLLGLLPNQLIAYRKGRAHLCATESSATEDLLALTPHQLNGIRGKRVAMIFQEPMTSLNPVFTIGDQLTEALQLADPDLDDVSARQRAIEALESVQIPESNKRIDHYPHQLSGGQRQRVMIAMALASEPDLLIADEPTTALDVTVQAGIIQLMQKLQKRTGMSILFITHDLALVSQIADQIAVMRAGKIVEQGTCNAVLMCPTHEYTRALLHALPENLPRLTVKEVPGESRIKSAPPLVQLDKLQVFFPVKKGLFKKTVDYIRAVDDIDLSINKGDIFALVGESGSGKSTLGRAILRLIEPTGGSIYYQHQALNKLNRREMKPFRQRMQIIFQDPASSLNPRLTVATALLEPMKIHGIGNSHDTRIDRAKKLLDDVHMSADCLWRYPHEFSGGQRQRIGIARALAINPEFIVCDEVTSALDVSVQADILQMLIELREQHELTLLFISHDISVVQYLSNKVAVMQNGNIVEQGSTNEICSQPQSGYTQCLLNAVPRLTLG